MADEVQKEKETATEQTPSNVNPNNRQNYTAQSQDNRSPIEKATELLAKIEEANKRTEELIMRQEELQARSMLSGRAEGGSRPKTTEELAEEEAQKVVDSFF